MPKRAVRITSDLDQQIQKAARERGYRTASALIRAAIEQELKQRGDASRVEEQTAASFDRLANEMRRVLRGQQALFALVDALTKTFLTCVPEPPAEVRTTSIAMARDRYTRLIKTAGSAMSNESRSAMHGLVANVEE